MSTKCHFKDQLRSEAINNFPRMSSKMSENDCNALFALMYEGKLPTKFIAKLCSIAAINPIFRRPHLLLQQEFLPYYF